MTANDNRRILAYLREHTEDMVEDLKRLIALESPTTNKAAVDALGAALAAELRRLGAAVEVIPKDAVGDVLQARWNAGEGGIVIMSHMDTVWDVGTVAGRPTRVDGDRLYGVGAMDMKGGIVIALWALRALRQLDLFPAQPITYQLNSDEETGSRHSAAEIESEALAHNVVFVTEPPQDGAYKTQRKGVSQYTITATGRAAHSGADHENGVNAIEEIAHQVIAVEAMTDYNIGTTANVGVISGGTRPNVVPAEARVEINVRAWTKVNQAVIHERMMSLKAVHPEADIVVEGGVGVPPMERTPEIAALFKRAQALAAEMGVTLEEGRTGGGSDGNKTAALGVPTLDGMGMVGEGGHAVTEYGEISSLPERAAIMAAMLRERL
ncbi:MAG: M20 family metallopeptidase [Chloroflexota bacterium]|nr:M20 family metallopeptidase [Chloroflexota bacterium]MDE2910829.1 M20 family metallopeptidase [Chloroflexota bacterium]